MSMPGMMPYMHFTGGDYLLFKPWAPSSHGAIAGACFGLIVLAIFQRWVSAVRSVLDGYWRRRARAVACPQQPVSSTSSDEKIGVDVESGPSDAKDHPPQLASHAQSFTGERPPPIVPPFIWKYDLSRGAMFALQALLAYVLMLSVMTFQVAYLISIVLGLGIGEVIFGRYCAADGHIFH